MKLSLQRNHYLPKEKLTEIDNQETDAQVFIFERNGKPCAIGFHGKAQKPDFRYRYSSVESRANSIQNFIDQRKAHAEQKAKHKAEMSKPHNFKLGEVLVSSWGYDQTNVDFYEVVRIPGKKTIEIRAIKSKVVSTEMTYQNVIPVKGDFVGEPMRKVVRGNRINVRSYDSASRWDGKPKYETAFGFGH